MSFLKKQIFRLVFGLICAAPLLAAGALRVQHDRRIHFDADWAEMYLAPSLLFIVILLPLMRCQTFFRLWDKYLYFKRACLIMLGLRAIEFDLVAASQSFGFLRNFRGLLDLVIFFLASPALYVNGLVAFHPPFLRLPHKMALLQYSIICFNVTGIALAAYIVLWAVIGLLFAAQTLPHYLRHGKWEPR